MGSHLVLHNCKVVLNSSGVMVLTGAAAELLGCTLSENKAYHGLCVQVGWRRRGEGHAELRQGLLHA